jgi:hypothetical protein
MRSNNEKRDSGRFGFRAIRCICINRCVVSSGFEINAGGFEINAGGFEINAGPIELHAG